MEAKHTGLAHHFADLQQQHRAALLGMWLFLATELMIFGGLFTCYTVYRSRNPAEFAAASNELNLTFGAINTVVLLTSSLTMAFAVYAMGRGRRQMATVCLVLTALLGTAFLVIKGFEYHGDYADNLIPGMAFEDKAWVNKNPPLNPGGVKLFLLLYYIMTGLHAVHLVAGITMLVILAVLTGRGRFTAQSYTPVELGGLYWHFVDVIWVFLLPLLYLIGVRH